MLIRDFINSGVTPTIFRMKFLELLMFENQLWRPTTPDNANNEQFGSNAEVIRHVKQWLCKSLSNNQAQFTSVNVRIIPYLSSWIVLDNTVTANNPKLICLTETRATSHVPNGTLF